MMLSAVRTVAETDDVHTIEGLAFPFKGRDTYGTYFSARTNFHWDMFPDTDPTDAVRATMDPQFIRPSTFHHGFDPEFGLARIGGWSPVRMDADGVWVQAQLDKRQTYYATRIAPLLASNALGLSGGSAEHSVRIDQKSGEILDWPAYEVALTPVESNPLAQLSVRAGEIVTILNATEPPAEPPAARAYSEAASDAAMGAGALGSLLYLLSCEADEPDQVDMIQRAIDALTEWLNAERAEVGTPEDLAESAIDSMTAYYSGIRALRTSDDAPADAQPMVSVVREDAKAAFEEVERQFAARAAETGAQVARRMIG